MTMTVSTNTPSGRLMDTRRVRRLLMALLCLVALGLLFTSYTQGIHRRSDEAVSFTGIDFLLGRPEGRSARFAPSDAFGLHGSPGFGPGYADC